MKATLKAWSREIPVTLEVKNYYNGNLAIQVTDYSEGYPSPYAKLTVNLGELPKGAPKEDSAFVDTNNCPWAEEFITNLGIAVPSGIFRQSGFCIYPLYYFNLKEVKKYEEA